MRNSDIQIVCSIIKCTEEDAKKALEEASGDIARAILLISSGK